jgi:hypothetical protein
MGGLKSKIDENTLISYLEQMNESDKPTTKIKVNIIFNNKINKYYISLKEKLMMMTMMI